MSEVAPPTQDELKRAILFIPCDSKDRLHKWIQVYLGLDVPDCIVDEDSDCSPMDMIWEVYKQALKGNDPDFKQVLYYASRDSFKTLGAAILEVLSVLHLQRSVAHMAAIEAQSKKSQQYVKSFFRKPFLRDYVVGDNEREIIVVRYHHKETGENLTLDQFEALSPEEQTPYEEISNYIKIIVCTMQGANSEHVPFMVVDEVDVVKDPKSYQESKMIPAPLNGMLPITLLTSTRKFSFGLVQKEIDNAKESGLQIRHWNIIDCTQACPPTRHLPQSPKLKVYRSDETLKTLSEEQYAELSDEQKERDKYVEDEAYAGCIQNCRMFAMCKGRLATEQKSKSKLLKPVEHTQGVFRTVSIPTAKAQLLCKKPSTEGLIYPGFDREVHMLTAAEMAEKITGDEYPPTLTKNQLVEIMKTRDLRWTAGMDFGYSHNFSVVCGPVDGNRKFVIEVISMPELEPGQQIQICENRIRRYNPEIFADTENPQLIKLFRKAGFRMKDWKKGPKSLNDGIDLCRMKMRPAVGEPQVFLLADDEGCELLARRLSQYHWKLSPDGTLSNIPDDTDDDECDAFRYDIMNVFSVKGQVQAPSDQRKSGVLTDEAQGYTADNWFEKVVQEHAGPQSDTSPESKGRGTSGGFKWDLS